MCQWWPWMIHSQQNRRMFGIWGKNAFLDNEKEPIEGGQKLRNLSSWFLLANSTGSKPFILKTPQAKTLSPTHLRKNWISFGPIFFAAFPTRRPGWEKSVWFVQLNFSAKLVFNFSRFFCVFYLGIGKWKNQHQTNNLQWNSEKLGSGLPNFNVMKFLLCSTIFQNTKRSKKADD